MLIVKEILDMLEIGLFLNKTIAKIAKGKFSHCAVDLDYCFRLLSTAPSHRIIALRVHPFKVREPGRDLVLLVWSQHPLFGGIF